jgi:hypothetical protein
MAGRDALTLGEENCRKAKKQQNEDLAHATPGEEWTALPELPLRPEAFSRTDARLLAPKASACLPGVGKPVSAIVQEALADYRRSNAAEIVHICKLKPPTLEA